MYYYNKYKGLSNYMDPFARLFCVKYDKSPTMDYYWMENEAIKRYWLKTSDEEDQSVVEWLENLGG